MSPHLDVTNGKQKIASEFLMTGIKMKAVERYILRSTRFVLLKIKYTM
jgi:hypothetical protein